MHIFTNIAIIVPQSFEIMKKISFVLIIGAIYFCCGKSFAANRTIKVQGSEVTHSLITEDKLLNQIEFLSDSLCGGRASGSKGIVEANFYITRRFKQLNIKAINAHYSKMFRTDNGTVGRNILGYLHCSGSNKINRYILIVAYYDGLGFLGGNLYPGADNNASGVAAMLGVAEMIGSMVRYGKTYPQNIIFAALDARQQGMRGAKSLWEAIDRGKLVNPVTGDIIRKENISVMVNIDQIGSSLSPLKKNRPDYMIMMTGGNSYFESTLESANSQYDINLDLSFDYYGSRDFTNTFYRKIGDQKIFIENKIPSVVFTSGITMNNNKRTDLPGTLNMNVLKKRVWLIFHWIEKII